MYTVFRSVNKIIWLKDFSIKNFNFRFFKCSKIRGTEKSNIWFETHKDKN